MRSRSWFHDAAGFAAALLVVLHASVLCAQPKLPAPEEGSIYLLVNRNSGRCLSVAGGSVAPGAKIVQGPTPDQAGASERWVLLGTDQGFRLRNHASRLVLEIGSANPDKGVQAIQWHDQVTATHQHWQFEPVEDFYVLRAGHSQLVLGIGQGSLEAGGRAIQWTFVDLVADQRWELRPAFQEYYWSFKDNPDKRDDFQWIGPGAENCVKLEPAGLRITLPVDHPARANTGVAKNLAIAGDFEITTGWQILAEPTPAQTGQGTGLFLGIDLVTERNRATLTRVVREGVLFTTWFELTKEGADKPFKTDVKYFPTTARAGQLRLTRNGAALLYEIAEPASNDFKILARHPFSDEEVKQIRLGGVTGGPEKSLDARVIDLRIRAKTLPFAAQPAAADARPAVAPPADPPSANRGWLVATLLVGLAVVLLFGIAGAALLFLRQRGAAPKAAAAPKHKR
jgi:hypothetical protein